MQINNNFSPSFTGFKQQNMQGLLEPLKKGVLKKYNKSAVKLNKFAEKRGVDVLFIKPTVENASEILSGDTNKIANAIKFAVRDTVNEIKDKFIPGIRTECAAVIDTLESKGADEELVTAATGTVIESSGKLVSALDGISREARDASISHALNSLSSALNPTSNTFTIKISGKTDGAIEKTIDSMAMPTKKGSFFTKFSKDKHSMKKMFNGLKNEIDKISQLNKIKDNFGI